MRSTSLRSLSLSGQLFGLSPDLSASLTFVTVTASGTSAWMCHYIREVPGLHVALLELGRDAGIPLALGRSVPWLTGRGHVAPVVQESAPAHLVAALSLMHYELGGDAQALAEKRAGNQPTPDLIHTELGCFIEVDEVQHFTSARLRTLERYPAGVPLGFDLAQYRDLVARWRAKGDKAYAHKVSKDFPAVGGRQAQRAYNDALRDLLAPTFTSRPVVRIAVPDRSLNGIVDRLREALASLT
jgi:hypothetical protein